MFAPLSERVNMVLLSCILFSFPGSDHEQPSKKRCHCRGNSEPDVGGHRKHTKHDPLPVGVLVLGAPDRGVLVLPV